jgi:hypothetical protein
MGGDYTRITFDPVKLFNGGRKQQGRVSLDSDFNEFEEIIDRRSRAEMYDTVGQAFVPLTTPDGFEIGVNGSGELTIGIGREYVDGMLAECFGDMSDPTATERDDTLGGLHGNGPVVYDEQPFWYEPGYPGLSPTANDINLAYLDVWQREVTVYEDPELREPALNGPDTATRMQTAWQVKVLQGADASSCDSPPAAWDDLIAASTGRLTATSAPAPPAPGPCVINPVGGYTGLENRLYRVEIHQAGTLGGAGKAKFKWSRDNASLAASVLSITPVSATESVITVSSTGRDSWMRFEHGDHIELLDDFVEFAMRETGTGGQLATILSVNHATGEIHVDDDLTGFSVVQEQHPRIRRWDIATATEPLSRDVNNGTPIALEEGITVTFGATDTDTLHAGDYWVFAARTAEGTIDELENEPPRGILHHFAKLALVTSGSPPSILDDCRPEEPPAIEGESCGCSVCVTEDSHSSSSMTIQMAVDQVIAAGGGTVCIGVGFYALFEPVTISDGVSIRIQGSGIGTILWYTGEKGGPAVSITSSWDVVIRDLLLATMRDGATALNAIEIANSLWVTLDRLAVFEDILALIDYLQIESTARQHGAAVAVAGVVVKVTVRDCMLAGGAGVAAAPLLTDEGERFLATLDLVVEDNLLFGSSYGVWFGADVDDTPFLAFLDQTRMEGNSVYGCNEAGFDIRGPVGLGEVLVGRNVVNVRGHGILIGADRSTVVENALSAIVQEPGRTGIGLVRTDADVLRDCRVIANRVEAFGGDGISIDADVEDVMIKQNIVRSCSGGIVMSEGSTALRISVANNQVSEIEPLAEESSHFNSVAGILLVVANEAEVLDNVVQSVALEDKKSASRAGILAVACPSIRVAGNEVLEVGPQDFDGITAGIRVVLPLERLDVLDNRVRRSGDEEKLPGEWYAVLVGATEEGDTWTRHAFLGAKFAYVITDEALTKYEPRREGGWIGIRGNALEADGVAPIVLVNSQENCTFAENWCLHKTGGLPSLVTLLVSTLGLSTNHVLGPVPENAAAIFADPSTFGTYGPAITAVGNITTGEITVAPGGPLGPPWDALNIRI